MLAMRGDWAGTMQDSYLSWLVVPGHGTGVLTQILCCSETWSIHFTVHCSTHSIQLACSVLSLGCTIDKVIRVVQPLTSHGNLSGA